MMDLSDHHHQSSIWSSNMHAHTSTSSQNSCNWEWASNNLTPMIARLTSNADTSIFSSNTAVWASNFLYYSLKPVSANAIFTSNTSAWTSNAIDKLTSRETPMHNRYAMMNVSFYCDPNVFSLLPKNIWELDSGGDGIMDGSGYITVTDEGAYTISFRVCFAIDSTENFEQIVSLVDRDGVHQFSSKTFLTTHGSISCGSLTTFLKKGQGVSVQVCPLRGSAICAWSGPHTCSYVDIIKLT